MKFDDPSPFERMLPFSHTVKRPEPTPLYDDRPHFSTGPFFNGELLPYFRELDRRAFRDILSDDVTVRRRGLRIIERVLRLKAEIISIFEDSQPVGYDTSDRGVSAMEEPWERPENPN